MNHAVLISLKTAPKVHRIRVPWSSKAAHITHFRRLRRWRISLARPQIRVVMQNGSKKRMPQKSSPPKSPLRLLLSLVDSDPLFPNL